MTIDPTLSASALSLRSVRKTYGNGASSYLAVKNLNLEVREGEFFTLLGPSGCGKTTTLRMIAGLEVPDSGSIQVGGSTVFSQNARVNVPVNERDISMVFQSYALWPHMTVRENVEFPLRMGKIGKLERIKRISNALDLVGLSDLGDRRPSALSGGQQQRVAVARALVKNARLLLFDEPLSNLDATLRAQMRVELTELQQRLGVTAIYVTHDQDEALTMSDRIGVMQKGNLLEVATPEDLYLRPQTMFGATFIGRSHTLSGPVTATNNGRVCIDSTIGMFEAMAGPALANSTAIGHQANLVFRPEIVELTNVSDGSTSARSNSMAGRIRKREFSGRFTRYTVSVGGYEITVNEHAPVRFAVGDDVSAYLPPERCWALAQSKAEEEK